MSRWKPQYAGLVLLVGICACTTNADVRTSEPLIAEATTTGEADYCALRNLSISADSPEALHALASVGEVCGVEHKTHDELCAAGDSAACLHALWESGEWRPLLDQCNEGTFLACQLLSYEPVPEITPQHLAEIPGVGGDILRLSYASSDEWGPRAQTLLDRQGDTPAQRCWGEFIFKINSARDCLAFELHTAAAYNRAELMASCRPVLQSHSKAVIELYGDEFGAAAYAQRAMVHFHVADQLLRLESPPAYASEAIALGVSELHEALQRAFDCGCGLPVVKRAVQRRREVEANALLRPAVAPDRAL